MIAQVTTEEYARWFGNACAGKPYFGCLLPVQLQLFGRVSSNYFAGPGIAIDAGGRGVIACGQADPEELASFLGFLEKHRCLTDGVVPAGWQKGKKLYCYALAAGQTLEQPAQPPLLQALGLRLNEQPSPRAVAQVLFADRPARQDDFYSELCTKRSHGKARVWTLEDPEGTIFSTAGAYALHDGQAYLACIQTAEPLRGQKLGGWLTARLANALAAEGYTVRLLCAEERRAFYTRLGFTEEGFWWEYTDRPQSDPITYETEEQNVAAIL